MKKSVEAIIGDKKLIIETGSFAKLAQGAAVVKYGDTVILATACRSKFNGKNAEVRSFVPLTVDYRERTYAAGKIPGGFFKREGRPREKEILTSRLIDRPIRPLINKYIDPEVQISIIVLSSDQINDPDIPAIIGASMALTLSDIPFAGIGCEEDYEMDLDKRSMKVVNKPRVGPIGAVRIGKVGDDFIVNPTFDQLENSLMDLVVAGTKSNVIMIEGAAKEVSEGEISKAIEIAHENIRKIVDIEERLHKEINQPKKDIRLENHDPKLVEAIIEATRDRLKSAMFIGKKSKREDALDNIRNEALQPIIDQNPDSETIAQKIYDLVEYRVVRESISKEGKRTDGRRYDEIRHLECQVGMLPRTHGSGFFIRGETQALVTITLGTSQDMQIMDDLAGEYKKRFMLHYNFPPFATGEVRPMRGPGRREIGHGNLAERSLIPVIPDAEAFPYTIRIVSDILESNGSSSMASVCGGSLSLMDAGVPISSPVAGIAMGLINEGKDIILTDIIGLEDHIGDMDFKVAGTAKGITALQMDVKVGGLASDTMKEVLERSKKSRNHILSKMEEVIQKPRKEISEFAPRILTIKIAQDKIKDVIGPGGKIIRKIIADTGAEIDINDDGTITVAAVDISAAESAQEIIKNLVTDAEIGKVYKGKVMRITNFGAFIEILPGKEGLVHVSEISDKYVSKVSDVLKEGQEIFVKCIDIDRQGRIGLSMKDVPQESGAC